MSEQTIVKFTEDELAHVKSLQDRFNQLVLRFGQLKIEKISIKRALGDAEEFDVVLEKEFASLKEEEIKMGNELTEKYGKGTLNPETGEFVVFPTE